MPKMICTHPFRYGTRSLQLNEEFDAENDEHARVLEASNQARRVNYTGQGYKTRQLVAETQQPIRAPQLGTERSKRRRDRTQ